MPPYRRPTYISPLTTAVADPALTRAAPAIGALQPGSTGVRIVPTAGPAPEAEGDVEPGGVQVAAPSGGDWYRSQMQALRPQLEAAAQSYGGALQAARDAERLSYDQQRQVQQEEIDRLSKPQGSDVLGVWGAALAGNTTTGSFGEALANAANAGLRQRADERRDQAARDEKLSAGKLALARLTAQQPNAQLDQFRDTLDQYKTINEIGGYTADMDIGYGLTPQDDQALVDDARRFPQKYIGQLGRQKVADAQARLSAATKQASDRQFELDKIDRQGHWNLQKEALNAGRPQPLDRVEANRIGKRKAELMSAAEAARGLDGTLSQLESARSRTNNEGMPGAATYSNWFGWMTDEAAAGQEVAAQATRLKLQLSESLKGAISNSEQEMLSRATPGMEMADAAAKNSVAGYRAATQRAKERAAFYETWVRTHGDDFGSDSAWDQYINDNPILELNENGELVVNGDNIGNWRSYVGAPEGAAGQGSTSQGGQPKPGYDLTETDLGTLGEGDVVEDEGGARYIIRGGQPVRIGE